MNDTKETIPAEAILKMSVIIEEQQRLNNRYEWLIENSCSMSGVTFARHYEEILKEIAANNKTLLECLQEGAE